MRVGREPVVRAGLKLLGEVGLDGLTLRAIAAELGVQAPTLYWRFKNKQDLIDEMASQVLADWIAEVKAGPPLDGDWRPLTLGFGRSLRRALKRYRDGARMVAGSYLTDGSLYGPMEAMLARYAADGITAADGAQCLMTAYHYVIGFVIEEQAVIRPDGTRNPQYDLDKRAVRIDESQFPQMRSLGRALFDNYDARFERGLAMIVAGFEALRT